MSYDYIVEIKLNPHSKAFDHFDVFDEDYIEGKTRRKPSDFDLHLALYLLGKEQLPTELLEPLVQWVRDNKMVVVSPPLNRGR